MTGNAQPAAPLDTVDGGTKVDMVDKDQGLVDLDKDVEGGKDVPLDEKRAAIFAKHAAKRREQIPGLTAPGEEPTPADTVEAAAGADKASGEQADPDQEGQITVKVNGKEKQVPKSKVEAAGGVDAYQKNAAASETLNAAVAERRRLQSVAEELGRREQELKFRETQQEVEKAVKPAAPANEEGLKSLARQYHEAMIDGDMDLADELLIKLAGARAATPVVDGDAIAKKAVAEAKKELTADERKKEAARLEQERLEAVAMFETEHADLATDPDLRGIVDVQTIKIHRDHPEYGPKTIIEKSIEYARNLVARMKGPETPSNPRLDAKRQQTTVRGSSSARALNRPAPPPPSKSDYVKNLRKARGLDA